MSDQAKKLLVTGRKHQCCCGCKVWSPAEGVGYPYAGKIEFCIRFVLGEGRWWLTSSEFLEQVEAGYQAKLRERLNPKPVNRQPAAVRTYWLNPNLEYVPRKKVVKVEE
jgi:hypothetical protein